MSRFPRSKSEAAFLFSYDRLRAQSDRLYFWTFTAASACTDLQFSNAWHRFKRRLDRRWRGELCGLRVFERHTGDGPRSGLLHCHSVVDHMIPIRLVKRLASGSGIGHVMWVEREWKGLGDYLSKYLTKQYRLEGIRGWAKFGHWDHCRVGSVVMESYEADLFRSTYLMFKGQRGAWGKTRAEVERIKTQRGIRDATLVVNGIAMPEPEPQETGVKKELFIWTSDGNNPF